MAIGINTLSSIQKLISFGSQLLLFGVIFFTGPLSANPQNGVVVAGNVSITNNGTITEINQSSDKAIINWDKFSINADEITRFHQPSSTSIILNRVVGNEASNILGRLTANGQVMLINPAGIIFGAGSKIDVAGLIATTARITDSDFLSGHYKFVQDPKRPSAIINNGEISVAERGLIALVAPGVENNGVIQANLGKVVLASGNNFTVDLYGDQLIQFAAGAEVKQAPVAADGRVLKSAVSNDGAIYADGGKVLITATAAADLVANTISMGGIVQARSATMKNGVIILSGNETGTVKVSGKIDASGKSANQIGGQVKVLGKQVQLTETANIEVSGAIGGGEILVGGNYQGKGAEQNAKYTFVDQGALLDASALNKGNGGRVIIWADDYTQYLGTIQAKGGLNGGDGGFAEVSGKEILNFAGAVDLTAPLGKTGELLLDPRNLTIRTTGPTTATPSGNPIDTYTAGIDASALTVANLQNALNSASVTVQTGSTGGQAGSITVANNITWGNSNTLTLMAHTNITINAGVTITNNSGGSLVLKADRVSSGIGTVNFGTGAHVTLSGGGNTKIYYNLTAYTSPTNYSSSVSGTLTAYMLIHNAADLQNMNTNLSGNYALNQNIDVSSIANFAPVGNSSTPFTGNFDGQNNTITGLTINRASTGFIGLFGAITKTVSDVKLANVNISGLYTVGGLVGDNRGTLSNVGVLSGTVTAAAESNFNVSAVGGVAGSNQAGAVITGAASLATVTGQGVYIGGLVGISEGTITKSYSAGNISGGSSATVLGGLAGNSTGTISNSYSLSYISGNNYTLVGGLVGEMGGSITNSYAGGTIDVTNSSFIGGLVGNKTAAVTNSYSTVLITGTGNSTVGGLFGQDTSGSSANTYWNRETSGINSSASGTIKTTAQLQAQATFNNWDFNTVWNIIEGTSFPYLRDFYNTTPRVISGSSVAGGNTQVNLAIGGSVIDSVRTGANGFVYFLEGNNRISGINNTIADNTPLLVYLDSGSTVANIVALAPSSAGSITGLSLTANTLSIGSSNTATISSNDLNTAKGSLASTKILYSFSGADLTLGNADNLTAHLTTTGTTSYTVNGSISPFTGSTNNLTFNGPVTLNGNITANGIQTYNSAVTVGANVTLSSGANAITFNSTVNGANTLSLQNTSAGTTGTVTFADNVTLAGLLTFGGSSNYTVIFNGSSNTFNDQVTFNNNAVTLGNNGDSFTFNGGLTSTATITLNSVLNTSDDALTLTSIMLGTDSSISTGLGTITIGAVNGGNHAFTVSNTGVGSITGTIINLSSFTKNGTGLLSLTGNNTYGNTTTIAAGTLSAGNVTALGHSAVTIASGATLNINGVTLNGITGLTINGTGVSGAGALTSTGTASINSSIPITLTADTSIGGTGSLTLANTLSGAFGLTKVGTGTLIINHANAPFTAVAINAGVLQYNSVANVIADTTAVTVASGATYNLNGFSDTIGSIAGAGNITLGSASLTTGVNNSSTTFSGAMSGTGGLTKTGSGTLILSGANTYTGATTVSAGTLAINNASALGSALSHTSGVTTATGAALQLNNVSLTPIVALTLNGSGISSSGALIGSGTASWNGNLTLGSDTLIAAGSAGDSLTINGTINGNAALSLAGAGAITLAGAVGDSSALTSVTSTAGTTNINTNAITTSGTQTYSATNLNANAVLTGSTVTFNSALTSDHDLTIIGDGVFASTVNDIKALTLTGTAIFNGAVGTSLALDSIQAGAAIINTSSIITNGDQIYSGASRVEVDTTLQSNNGNITLGALDGAHNVTLTVSSGGVNLQDIIGGNTALTSLTVTGATNLSGGSIATTQNQTYHSPITLSTNSTLSSTAGAINFNNTVDGNYNLIVSSASEINVAADLGAGTALNRFVSNGSGTLHLGADITAQGGTLIFNTPVVLTDNIALVDAGTTGIQFNNTLNGNYNLTLTAAEGNIEFATVVGGNQALNNLIITDTNNVTANAAMHVAEFIQQAGAGLTSLSNLIASDDISIISNQIVANVTGASVFLNGTNGVTGSAIARELSLGGTNGSVLINTIVNDYGGKLAVDYVTLAGGSSGIFLVNGCVVGLKCITAAPDTSGSGSSGGLSTIEPSDIFPNDATNEFLTNNFVDNRPDCIAYADSVENKNTISNKKGIITITEVIEHNRTKSKCVKKVEDKT